MFIMFVDIIIIIIIWIMMARWAGDEIMNNPAIKSHIYMGGAAAPTLDNYDDDDDYDNGYGGHGDYDDHDDHDDYDHYDDYHTQPETNVMINTNKVTHLHGGPAPSLDNNYLQ